MKDYKTIEIVEVVGETIYLKVDYKMKKVFKRKFKKAIDLGDRKWKVASFFYSVEEIEEFIKNVESNYFTFGKWKGYTIRYVKNNDKEYLDWILKNVKGKEELKETIKLLLEKGKAKSTVKKVSMADYFDTYVEINSLDYLISGNEFEAKKLFVKYNKLKDTDITYEEYYKKHNTAMF